ncbi:MAG: TldD/PmbA family protein [Thermoplasmata archaeon]
MSKLKETAEKLVEVARDAGADDAIAEVIDSSTDQIRFSNSMIDTSNFWREAHAHVFVVVDGRTMSSDVRDLKGAPDTVREIVRMAKLTPVNEGYKGIASGRFKYRRTRTDPRMLSLRNPARFVHDAIGSALANGAVDVGGTLFVRRASWGIASSKGALAEDGNASMDLSVRAFSQPEASGQAVCVTPTVSKMNATDVGARAADLAVKAKDPVQGEEGKMDLVMEPLMIGSMTVHSAGMTSALAVELGMSMYAKKIGKMVASEDVTIIDDPSMSSMTRRTFDHEGMPTRKNIVIKDGMLKTYLHNTSTAKRFKTRSTANAGPMIASSFNTPNEPVMFHPVLKPGEWKLDEIVEDTKNGLYLNNTWYTRYQNYSTGDFSTIPRDAILLIRNGEIAGSVKNIRVSDNMLRLWKSVDAVSRNAEEIFWWEEAGPGHLPAARAKKVKITRSS